MRGAVGAGDEPLAAAHHVAIVLLLGARQHHAGIGTRAGMRLGHHERRAHLALDDRPQPLFLLLGRTHFGEQVHVAVVGRHAVNGERPEDRARRFLIDRRPSADRQSHAAKFLRRLWRPQARGTRLDPHHFEPVVRNVLVVGKIGRVFLQRHDMFVDESAHLEAQRFDFRGE
jgi:hypothetical protein